MLLNWTRGLLKSSDQGFDKKDRPDFLCFDVKFIRVEKIPCWRKTYNYACKLTFINQTLTSKVNCKRDEIVCIINEYAPIRKLCQMFLCRQNEWIGASGFSKLFNLNTVSFTAFEMILNVVEDTTRFYFRYVIAFDEGQENAS